MSGSGFHGFASILAASLIAACGPGSGAGPSTATDSSAESTDDASSGSATEPSASSTLGATMDVTSDSGDGTSADTGGPMGLGGACEGVLSDSFVAWQAARDEAGGTYSYVVQDSIVLADLCRGDELLACGTTTSIIVQAGQVVGRSFSSMPTEGTAPEDCPEAYTEQGADVGTHADGFPAIPLEDVYGQCCDLVQMQGGYYPDYRGGYEAGDIVVTLGAEGLLERCTAQYCDDCGCSGGPTWWIDSIGVGQKG